MRNKEKEKNRSRDSKMNKKKKNNTVTAWCVRSQQTAPLWLSIEIQQPAA